MWKEVVSVKKDFLLVLIKVMMRESRAKEKVKGYDGLKSGIGVPTVYRR